MSNLVRVGFTGTHGTGKTVLSGRLASFLEAETGIEPHIIGSTTRLVKELGFTNNHQMNFESQYMMVCLRQGWELEAKLLDQHVVAERCLLDEYVYTRYVHHYGRMQTSERRACEGLLKATSDILKNTYVDKGLFDVIFRLPISQVAPLEADNARIDDKDFQKSIDWMFDRVLMEHPELRRLVVNVPDGTFDEMMGRIEETVRLWL